jgi:sugar (pentulose or hexulose) kinase
MVATNAVAPRTGNVRVGTSVFAMVVLERALTAVHPEIDIVTTPAGDPVAMVHCNNGSSELNAWSGVFGEFAAALGVHTDADAVYSALLGAALEGAADGGGVLAYNFLSGEPIAGLEAGRPIIARTPGSSLTLANLMRAQAYGVFATLSLGMRVLADEGVAIDRLVGHGGLFRTPGVAQRLLAAAVDAPVAVEGSAGEGGAWGIAVLAAYLGQASDRSLADYLANEVFAAGGASVVAPEPDDVAGFVRYLEQFQAGLDIERTAVATMKDDDPTETEDEQA